MIVMSKTVSPQSAWSVDQLLRIHDQPLLNLVYQAATVHRAHHDPNEVQVCTLLSIKTGGCSEDCAYCSQSARYETGVSSRRLVGTDEVLAAAREAKRRGSTRFCMGAAWPKPRTEDDFENVLEMVRAVRALGLEACCTLGLLSAEQAKRLKEAGLTAYNHNLDTGEGYYDQVVTTRTYAERLATLNRVRDAGISLCCGGILGMGEDVTHRLEMLMTLSSLDPPPESVPINALVPIKGTPLAEQEPVSIWEMVRMIATTRLVLPLAMVRLSAGRLRMSPEGQALCFLAGANSIFSGEKLLTTPNPDSGKDQELFQTLGLTARPAFKQHGH